MKKFLSAICLFLFFVTLALAQTAHHYHRKCKHPFHVVIPIQKEAFEKKRAQGPPDWMIRQIRADLSAYETTGITQQMLDRLFYGEESEPLDLVRFSISNRRVSFSIGEKWMDSRHFRHILRAIQTLNELVVLPDTDFIISLKDSIDEEKGCPLFVFAKRKEVESLVLIPDFKALTGYPTLRTEMEIGEQKHPWEKKKNQAFWRGATTGAFLTSANWDQIARCKLALLSLAHPKELNAQLNGVVQCDPEVPSLIKAKGIVGQTVDKIAHLEYKYLVDVDGNSCSFERYFWSLLSNSVVLKQITSNVQWYYGALKPYEHFIPVKEDLSDLIEQTHWAREHDEAAKKIAENGTAFVKNNLSVEDVYLYMAVLIQEYAHLQRTTQFKNCP